MFARLSENSVTAFRTLCLRQVTLVLLLLIACQPGYAQIAENAAPNERLIISTAGDTFSLVSLREFGTTAFGRLIAEYNRLPYEQPLSTGQVLRIPISPDVALESANVVFAKGESQVRIRGNQQDLRDISTGDKIYIADVIKTAESGFVSLRFPSGTLVNVQPESVVKLASLDCLEERESCVISLDAQSGGITTNVTQRKDQPARFNVRTPHASAAVRGTEFDIDASDEQVLVGVTEGDVAVTAQGESTDLARGLGLKTLAGQKSQPPVQLLAEPNFRRIPPRVTEQDTFSWFTLENASNYILAVAADSEGASVQYSIDTVDLTHSVQQLPAGEYFVQLRAIDADGFKGFVSRQALLMADLDNDAFVPTLTPITEADQLWLSVADIPESITELEVQFSFDQNFREVTSVDVPADGGVLVAPTDAVSYFRARSIVNASTVGLFGPVLSVPAR